MQPKLGVIDTAEGIEALRAYLADKDFVAYDCETTGLLRSDLVIGLSVCASEDEAFYVILHRWDAAQAKLIDLGLKEDAKPLVSDLKSKNLLMHNGTFDCMMAEAYFKISLIDALHTDTMILAHLLNENRRIGLKELAKDLFGEDAAQEAVEMKASVLANGGQLTKACYEMYKADSHLMAKYGAKDAWMTYKLFITLVPELYEQGLEDFFYVDESMPLLKGPTYEMNNTGLQVDLKQLTMLQKQLEAECLEARAFVYQEIDAHVKEKYPAKNKKDVFNIGASQQLSWLLFGQLKLEFGTLTKAGKLVCKELGLKLPYTPSAKRDFIELCLQNKGMVYEEAAIVNGKKKAAKKFKDPWAYIACDKKTLKKLAPRYTWIERLLEYQRKMKLLTTYVKGIQSRVQYGVIYSSFLQHGTPSGRYASRNPNFQNLPRDDKRIKECIIARPGKVFVGADQSQLEPRVFSHYSGDERLMAAFDGTSDFYSVVGMEVFDITDAVPLKEGHPDAFGIKYKRLRDTSKTIALAAAYGASAFQLAPTTGKSTDDTQQDIDNYFEKFPGVRKMMTDAHDLVKEHGFVSSLFGRKRRLPEAKRIGKLYGKTDHTELPYDARNILNMAVNHRIQSTGASIVNRGAIKFNQNAKLAGIDAKIVLQVHDQLVVECKESDSEVVAMILQDAMETAVLLKGIAFEAVPRIGSNLGKL